MMHHHSSLDACCSGLLLALGFALAGCGFASVPEETTGDDAGTALYIGSEAGVFEEEDAEAFVGEDGAAAIQDAGNVAEEEATAETDAVAEEDATAEADAGTDADEGSSADANANADASDDGPAFPSVEAFDEDGPFATASSSLGPDCTFFIPDPLGADGRRHPVVVWGNGTTMSPSGYATLLNHLASHGFIVAAADTGSAGTGDEMLACLDYLLDENADPTSDFYQKVSSTRFGASGHSQGGAGALNVGRDPRIVVTAPFTPYVGSRFGFDSAVIGQQNGPMFLMSGSMDPIAYPYMQQTIFDGANVPVFWGTLIGGGHFIPNDDGGEFRGPATAWLRYYLMDDQSASDLFFGTSCGLCSESQWFVERKDIR